MIRHRNGDVSIRTLERAVALDPEDLNSYIRLLREKERAGLLTDYRLIMAARLGHLAARLAAPEWEEYGEIEFNNHESRSTAINALSDYLNFHDLKSRREMVSFACECAERSLHVFERVLPHVRYPRIAIESARRWVISPNDSLANEAYLASELAAYSSFDDSHSMVVRDAALASSSAALVASSYGSGVAAEACRLAWVAMSISESELIWQKLRLAKYLLGEVTLPPLI